MQGLPERLYSTIRPILAPEIEVKVSVAQNPALDAWHGMAQFANTKNFDPVCVTFDEYQEWGPERTKRWWGGNWNMAF
jgi:actin-related protein 5